MNYLPNKYQNNTAQARDILQSQSNALPLPFLVLRILQAQLPFDARRLRFTPSHTGTINSPN